MEALKATARTILWNVGIDYGPNKIARLCLRFKGRVERNGFAFFDFLANAVQLDAQQRRAGLANPEIARVISYADPTGETAARNVDRERGSA
ncbi:hypothetical protein [Phycicoccus sp.]|uniref:hypothetical protein n=1 Tax=Phycicoccus sp. TaxID=1902410 RepID=UPI002BA25E87|nr:hypothetical protein [Phycicoccus sp.]HMM93980.1 hypothetical protein [Phycicoccus sp.]